jgi:hypothetical protein
MISSASFRRDFLFESENIPQEKEIFLQDTLIFIPKTPFLPLLHVVIHFTPLLSIFSSSQSSVLSYYPSFSFLCAQSEINRYLSGGRGDIFP